MSLAQGLDPFAPLAPPAAERPWLSGLQGAASARQIAPGQMFFVALDVRLKDGWVFYSPSPGPVVLPGGVSVAGGPFQSLRQLWPADVPHASLGASTTEFVYQGRFVVFVAMRAPPDAKAGAYTVRLGLTGQACGSGKSAACIAVDQPTPAEAEVAVQVGPATVENPSWAADYAPLVAAAMTIDALAARHGPPPALVVGNPSELTVWAGLGLSLLAGLILNVMPCVLPVIPLKILSIVQLAGQSRRRFLVLGLAFAGGIMLFFLGLATASGVLRVVTGHAFNWGEHFQSVSFRIAMAMLLVAIAANLFGLFTILVPGKIASLAGGTPEPSGRYHAVVSALGSGVLAAVLSTPCSFAVLTVALAWAQTQALWLGTLGILVIGAGMAAPYAILTAFPKLVSWLPKPGRWMEILKQSMGFVLLIVAIWLIGSVSDYSYPLWVVAYGAVLVFCLWAWGAWVRYDSPLHQRITIRSLAVLLAVMAGVWMLRPPQPPAVRLETFDEAKIDQARREGRIVLVDFTANWCLTCKTVEAWVYNDAMVADELTHWNVLAMKGDVTTSDLPANRMLRQLQEPGVPVTVIFPPYAAGQDAPEPIRLRGIFARSALSAALEQASRWRMPPPAVTGR